MAAKRPAPTLEARILAAIRKAGHSRWRGWALRASPVMGRCGWQNDQWYRNPLNPYDSADGRRARGTGGS